MPGHRSGLFWVNIGVPQGSPLSPILFALFTAGLLKALDETRILGYNFNGNVEKYAFAYADDNDVVVISDSVETNCKAFEKLHQVTMAWADEHGASFGPSKYSIMHFQPPG